MYVSTNAYEISPLSYNGIFNFDVAKDSLIMMSSNFLVEHVEI
jgi:hypothetical protein